MSADPNSINIVFTNTSGAKKFFSFLPPHGRTLEAGARLVVGVDIASILNRSGDVRAAKRARAAGQVSIALEEAPPIG